MNITEVRIKLMRQRTDRLRAFASITIGDDFVVHDLRVIEGRNNFFVAMPSRKLSDSCLRCSAKNELKAKFCSSCGAGLDENRATRGPQVRDKFHVDVAHPINTACREMLQSTVLAAYREEKDRADEDLPVSEQYEEKDAADEGLPPSELYEEKDAADEGLPPSEQYEEKDAADEALPPSEQYEEKDAADEGLPPSELYTDEDLADLADEHPVTTRETPTEVERAEEADESAAALVDLGPVEETKPEEAPEAPQASEPAEDTDTAEDESQEEPDIGNFGAGIF